MDQPVKKCRLTRMAAAEFTKGDDNNEAEERPEVGVTVWLDSTSQNDGRGYLVFKKAGSDLTYMGQLNGGSHTFMYQSPAPVSFGASAPAGAASGPREDGYVAPFWADVDANMSGGAPNDSDEKRETTPMSLIVDVNNGLTNNAPRNGDTMLQDNERDSDYSYSDDRRVEPLTIKVPNPQWLNSQRFVTRMVLVGDPSKVRIFDGTSAHTAILGATASGPTQDCQLTAAQTADGLQTFWIEGIEAGEFAIRMELWDPGYQSTQPYAWSQEAHFEVNVDREPVASGDSPKFLSRNRVRATKAEANLRAIRGKLIANPDGIMTDDKRFSRLF
jgi:hypothetical protein